MPTGENRICNAGASREPVVMTPAPVPARRVKKPSATPKRSAATATSRPTHAAVKRTVVLGAGALSRRRAVRVRTLTAEAKRTAVDAGRLMDAGAPVRLCFFRADAPGYDVLPDRERTPMSKMIFGGQGGEVRLKLYLSILWLGARKPYAVENKPAAAWARLFGLSEPDKNGAQRVGAAIDWLVDNGFMLAGRGRGRPARLVPRHERGGCDYYRPQEGDKKNIDWWITLPQVLWSRGWMAVLSGAALASLIIIWDETDRHDDTDKEKRVGRGGIEYQVITKVPWVWLAESVLVKRYRVSYDVWEKGTLELEKLGLIGRRLRGDVTGFGPRQRRRQVRLELDALTRGPEVVSGR